jgi:hypothetical protein
MKIVTLDLARTHVKADGDDDTLLTQYIESAEAACEREIGRNVYVDQAALDAAKAALPATVLAASEAYEAAVDAAYELDDDRATAYALAAAEQDLIASNIAVTKTRAGLVLPQHDLTAAVLLTVGHLYRNRETVVTGQGASAVEVPEAASALLSRLRYVGPLL